MPSTHGCTHQVFQGSNLQYLCASELDADCRCGNRECKNWRGKRRGEIPAPVGAAALSAHVGKRAKLRVPTGSDIIKVGVDIIDARHAYGRTDYRVRPCTGAGETWVSAASLSDIGV